MTDGPGSWNIDYGEYKKAFDRISAINKEMSAADKIKLVVVDGYFLDTRQIAPGEYLNSQNYQDMMDSKTRLELAGVNVISYFDPVICFSLSRDPAEDANDVRNYCLTDSLNQLATQPFYDKTYPLGLMVPGIHRTLASPYGAETYVHYGSPLCLYDYVDKSTTYQADGFASAYEAGLFTLCLQSDQALSLGRFTGVIQGGGWNDDMSYFKPPAAALPVGSEQIETWTVASMDPNAIYPDYFLYLPYYHWIAVETSLGMDTFKKEAAYSAVCRVVKPIGIVKYFSEP